MHHPSMGSGVNTLRVIYNNLYFPNRWPQLAETLTGMLYGSLSDSPVSSEGPRPVPYNLGIDSVNGIRCSDALWRASAPEDILDQVKYQATVSKSFSDMMYEGTGTCAAWKMKAKEQYVGNFTVKTNFPVMLVNSIFGVATPMVSAFNASAGFEGSVVLKNSSYGVSLLFFAVDRLAIVS